MKFVHAADLHLDSPMRGLQRYEGAPAARMKAATRQALENLVGLCIEEQVAFLLIAGDLFDGRWKDYGTGLFFAAQMKRLSDANINVFVVRGNHDAESTLTTRLRLPSNVHLFSADQAETVVLDDLQVAIHGHSYQHAATADNLAAGYPEARDRLLNIGLLHTALNGRPGHADYAPCSLNDLRSKGYDYWALGHVHTREIVDRDPWVVFPGNLQGRHVREPGAKGASLVTVLDGTIEAVEHRNLDVARWTTCRVNAAGVTEATELLDRVAGAFQLALEQAEGRLIAARLILEGATSLHASLFRDKMDWRAQFEALAIEAGAAGGELWVEKLRVETTAHVTVGDLSRSEGPLAELLRHTEALRDDPEAVQALAESLSEFATRIPPGARPEGDHSIDSSEAVLDLFDQVEQLLVGRLVETG